MPQQRQTLLVISARLNSEAQAAVREGRWPQKDFFALQAALNADVLDYDVVERSRWARVLRRVIGIAPAQALLAARHAGRYEAIFTDGEQLGIPLGLLLALLPRARRPRHVTIGHLVSTPAKMAMFRWLQPQRGIDTVLLHATRQLRLVRGALGRSGTRLVLTPYGVDTEFWRPLAVEAAETGLPVVSAAGLEYRDYPTLLRALTGLPVEGVIAAGSRWSTHRDGLGDEPLPGNVTVTALDYRELRALYARSAVVVVPLRQVDNQAGITTLLEAMAMGRPVILTRTRGQTDVLCGRMCDASGPVGAPLGGATAFGVPSEGGGAEVGLYVRPGDADALRAAISYLLAHPETASRMGMAGRRLVERYFSLERFAGTVSSAVLSDASRVPMGRTGGADRDVMAAPGG